MNHGGEQKYVALSGVSPLALAQAPEVSSDIGEQTGIRLLQLAQALARERTYLAVEAVIGAVNNRQEQLDQAVEHVVRGDDDRGDGEHHLLLERERDVDPIGGGLDQGAEGFDQTVEGFGDGIRVGCEERVGELLEEDDELELEGEVPPVEGGEGLVDEDWVRGGPSVAACTAVLEIVD